MSDIDSKPTVARWDHDAHDRAKGRTGVWVPGETWPIRAGGQMGGGSYTGPSFIIPHAVAADSYAAYVADCGEHTGGMEYLGERGGFTFGEMDMQLPGWRDRCDLTDPFERLRKAGYAEGLARGREEREDELAASSASIFPGQREGEMRNDYEATPDEALALARFYIARIRSAPAAERTITRRVAAVGFDFGVDVEVWVGDVVAWATTNIQYSLDENAIAEIVRDQYRSLVAADPPPQRGR